MQSFKLVSLNSKYSHSSLAPWYIKAGISAYFSQDSSSCEEISVEIFEGTINEDFSTLYAKITENSFDFIAFSCYIWNIEMVKKLAVKVKSNFPDIPVIFGGPEVSYNAEAILKTLDYVDFVSSGEGEKPIPTLLEALSTGAEIPAGFGICYRKNGEIILDNPYISGEIPPDPYCDEYFERLNGRICYIETNRGCPYSCAFCLSGRCTKLLNFDMETVKSNIIKLANSSSNTVKFVDRTFNANKARSKEILRFILDNYGEKIPSGVCFHIEAAGDILDDETIEIIKSMPNGALQIEIGMQSFNEKTLSYINRKTDTKKLISNIQKLTGNANVHIHIDLIAGLPFEDFASFRQSFNIGYNLGADMLQMGFLKLLHGADMRENSEKFPCEYSLEPPYEVTATPWLTCDEISTLRHAEDALDRLYNSGRFPRTLEYILAASSLEPFEIYFGFGKFAHEKGTAKIPLDEYIKLVFDYFSAVNGVDKSVLRDKMVCDRFATNSFGALPKALQIHDPKTVSEALAYLEENTETARKKGVKRSIAILYSKCSDEKKCAVFADYDDKSKNKHGLLAPNYKINVFYF